LDVVTFVLFVGFVMALIANAIALFSGAFHFQQRKDGLYSLVTKHRICLQLFLITTRRKGKQIKTNEVSKVI